MHSISSAEFARRRPVWEALSAFFLDTELDDAQLRDIANTLRASAYKIAELEDILVTEVAPLLYAHARSVAGAWSGFSAEWIEERIAAGRHRAICPWYRFADRWACRGVLRDIFKHDWPTVLNHLAGA